MDGNHFDDMVRAVTNRGSRRGVLFALTGGLLAALIPYAGSGKNKNKKKKKGKKGKKGCNERCGGRCVSKCPDIMTRNPVSCLCQCPEDMQRCGQVCVGEDRCCPGEKECGGGCIHEDECCPHDEDCCPRPDKTCPDGSCVPEGACCPGVQVTCRSDPRGCCLAGVEECANDGCCPVGDGQQVCNGFCIDTNADPHHCGDCNAACQGGENCVNGKCGGEETCPFPQKKCGDKCCEFGEDCCHGVCAPQGSAACTNDGWCPFTEAQACLATGMEGPCCRFSAGEICCAFILGDGTVETHCCPDNHDQCAPSGCCPAGTMWKIDCGACCTNGVTGCNACHGSVPGRG
jgi:hypothetical protein